MSLCILEPSALRFHMSVCLPPPGVRSAGAGPRLSCLSNLGAQCTLDMQECFQLKGNLEIVYHLHGTNSSRLALASLWNSRNSSLRV